MFCPKCHAHMFEDHFGFPQSTTEVWRCTNARCAYTFEMRLSTRGFNFRFETPWPTSSRPAFRDNGWGFPHQVFDQVGYLAPGGEERP